MISLSPLTLQQHNMEKNMDRDPKKVASKGGLKPMRTGIQRTALGDIRNVTKVYQFPSSENNSFCRSLQPSLHKQAVVHQWQIGG